MDYPAYPVYRESGIEWLGKIPDHWELKKFRFLFSFGRGLGITKENLLDEGVPCINYGEIHSKYGFEVIPEKHPLKCVTPDYLETDTSSLLSAGDFVFADTSEDIEGSGNFSHLNSDVPTFAGYHTVIARPISNDVPRYMAYLFDSLPYRFQIRKTVSGVKVFSITQAILKNCYLWLPQKTEQIQIAQFLDHKTQQIDQLISKKQALIDKLNEQRIALITHAVTKGLNPAVTLEDSGVEWLGEVPEHWDVMKFKDRCNVVSGQVDPALSDYENLPLVAPDHIEKGKGKFLGAPSSKEQGAISGKYLFDKGDLLYSKIRPELNKLCIAQSQGLCSADMYAIRTQQGLKIEFLFYFMLSKYFHQFAVLESMRVAMPKINRDALGILKILVPPLAEQQKIIEQLVEQIDRIDRMVELNRETIDKLKEYRTALITAAVTGKIDLRTWQKMETKGA